MSKFYFFFNDIKPLDQKTILPDVYCPTGGYADKGLNKSFTSKGEKVRYLRAHGMREAEPVNPNKMLGGTEGCSIKRRGRKGNFQARPTPAWIQQEVDRDVG